MVLQHRKWAFASKCYSLTAASNAMNDHETVHRTRGTDVCSPQESAILIHLIITSKTLRFQSFLNKLQGWLTRRIVHESNMFRIKIRYCALFSQNVAG